MHASEEDLFSDRGYSASWPVSEILIIIVSALSSPATMRMALFITRRFSQEARQHAGALGPTSLHIHIHIVAR